MRGDNGNGQISQSLVYGARPPFPSVVVRGAVVANGRHFADLRIHRRAWCRGASRTGRRVWAFVPGESALAATSLDTKHVTTLRVDGRCDAVFEIPRAAGGGRALLALQTTNGVGATVFDAETPEGSNRRLYGALLTEGPYDDQR